VKPILNIGALSYFFFIIFAAVYGYKEYIPTYMLVMQSLIAIAFFICLNLSLKIITIWQLLFVVLFYNIIFSVILRCLFWEYTGKPFADAVDCYFYDGLVLKYLNEEYFTFFTYGLSNVDIDDFGFLHILYVVYYFIGDVDIARNVLLVLNSLCITYTSYLVYKFCLMLNIKMRTALVAGGGYGFFPFMVVTSAVGLKENFFCLFITLSFYLMYVYKDRKSIYILIITLLLIASTWLFRMAVSLMIFLSFCLFLFVNDRNKKMIFYLVVIGIILTPFILNFFLIVATGFSLDHILAVTEARGRGIEGNASMKWGIQILSSFLGPFPNFTRTAQYGIYHSAGLLLKSLMSLFFFCGLSAVWRRMDIKIYPVVLYLLMGGVMLVLAGVALDMRYHVTFFSLWIILGAYAWQYAKPKKITFFVYTIFIVFLILVYNLR
jgi:hypothetical protein